ncbi:hypothetical protein CsatA_018286 [Cannabis sativa]
MCSFRYVNGCESLYVSVVLLKYLVMYIVSCYCNCVINHQLAKMNCISTLSLFIVCSNYKWHVPKFICSSQGPLWRIYLSSYICKN